MSSIHDVIWDLIPLVVIPPTKYAQITAWMVTFQHTKSKSKCDLDQKGAFLGNKMFQGPVDFFGAFLPVDALQI